MCRPSCRGWSSTSARPSRRRSRRSSRLRETGSTVPILARSGGRDEGNAALELVVLAPVLLFILGLVVAAGRTSIAQGAVEAAARNAARQASISLTPGAAQAAALSSAKAALGRDGLDCDPQVVV